MNSQVTQEIVVLIKNGNLQQALNKIEKQLKKAGPTQILLQLKGETIRKLGNDLDSAETYKRAALLGGKNTAICWYNTGVQYQKILKIPEAVEAYKNAIQLENDHNPSRNNLCVLLYNQSRSDEALQHAKWLRTHSQKAEHLINAGYVLRGAGCYDEADQAFRLALKYEPDNWKVVSAALQSAQYVCDWTALDCLIARYQNEIYRPEKFEESKELHHVHIAWCSDEETNYKMAAAATKRVLGEISAKYSHADHRINQKIKIGYVSSDFFNHATLHLLIGVLEHHDKERFEVYAYCHSQNDNSAYRKRFLKSIDHFTDITIMSDDQAAECIKNDGIDVLVDLKGFTDKHRLKIFAKRPAPIQVTYIGFPGTSGANFFDYAITDKWVTPDSSKAFYSEKLCRLPESYQCNDNNRPIASNLLDRKSYSLPEGAFVFCCFNQSYKIERTIFEAWIQILRRVDNSVLWILDLGDVALNRLKCRLEEAGIDSNRIVVTDKVTPPIHLKRLQDFANLALDTRIVNGHTTTSDALWAGVPVVTLYGTHFNSRVSTTLLNAVGLGELVTYSIDDYVEKAVLLATDAIELKRIKEKLKSGRFVEPLFDTERFTRSYEAGIKLMVENFKIGKVDHIDVPALPPRELPFMSEMNTVSIDPRVLKKRDNPDVLAAYFVINHDCPVCNSAKSKIIRRCSIKLNLDETSEEITSDWALCGDCGHVFRKRCLNVDGLTKVTDEKKAHPLTRIQSYNIIESLHHQLSSITDCGQVKVMEVYPADRIFFATGLEFGYSMSAVVDRVLIENFKKLSQSVIATDFLKMNVNGQPDIIYFGRSLERALAPRSMLQRAKNIIGDSGLIAVLFSNHSSLEWIDLNAQNQGMMWDRPTVNNMFNRKDMLSLFSNEGFELCFCAPVAESEAGVVMAFRKQLIRG